MKEQQKIKFKEWSPYDLDWRNWHIAHMFALFPVIAIILIFFMGYFVWDIPNKVPMLEYWTKALLLCLCWWLGMVILIFIPFCIIFIWATIVSRGKPRQYLKIMKDEELEEKRLNGFAEEYIKTVLPKDEAFKKFEQEY